MKFLAIIFPTFFLLFCSNQNSEVKNERTVQPSQTEVDPQTQADATSPHGAEPDSLPTLLNLVEALEGAKTKEDTETALRSLSQAMSEEDKNLIDPLLLNRIQELTDDLKDAHAGDEDGNKLILDIIGDIKNIIVEIIDHVVNTAIVGGMGCGVARIDLDHLPADGSDECRIAKCVFDKCKAPDFRVILCSDDKAWPLGKPGVCKIPGNSLCGIPTGMCVPNIAGGGDGGDKEIEGDGDDDLEEPEEKVSPTPSPRGG